MDDPPPRHDGSFLVRIWWESGQRPAWRGRVEHLPSQTVIYFDRADELLAFIAQWTGDAAGAPEEREGSSAE